MSTNISTMLQQKRTESINVRFYPSEIAAIQAVAKKNNIPPATLCYRILKQHLIEERGDNKNE